MKPEKNLSKFVGPDVVSTMISHTTAIPLVGDSELEHEGITKTLRDLTESRVSLNDPIVAAVLPYADFVSFAFWAEEPAFTNPAIQVIRGHVTYDKVIRDGFWSRAATWISDFDLDGEHTSGPGQRLRVAEIHAPHVEGCTGTFGTTKTGSLDISIKAFGLGYQKVKRVMIVNSFEQPQACGALTTGVQFVVHEWKHRFSGTRRALIRFIAIDGALAGESLSPSEAHHCGNTYGTAAATTHSIADIRGWRVGEDYSDVPMRAAANKATSTHEMELEQGSVYSASLELPLTWLAPRGAAASAIPKLGVSVETRVAHTIKMSWKLVSGHDYMRFRAVPGDMRMFWVWD